MALDDRHARLIQDIAQMLGDGTPYADIVRYAVQQHRVSESTAKRRIREVRATQDEAA